MIASATEITRRGRIFLILWTVGLVLLFAISGCYFVGLVNRYRQDAMARHNARINPAAVEAGLTAPEEKLPLDAHPRQVQIGIYLEGISSISVLDSTWSPVMYLWFRWTGDDIDPGETFRLVEGEIESKELLRKYDKGDEHYVLYLVKAQITKFFDAARFPADDHLLTIAVEDAKLPWSELEYVADSRHSNISSRCKIPGYVVAKTGMVVKPHSYRTSFGDPRVADDARKTCSQFVYGVWNRRPGLGTWFKVFIGLYAATLIAMLAFFIKPTDVDPRFGLGVGGFFGAVANTIVSAAMVPDSGMMTLLDIVNGIGMVTIFLSIVQSTISLYLYDVRGSVRLSRVFDMVSFLVLAGGYLVINTLIVMAAYVTQIA